MEHPEPILVSQADAARMLGGVSRSTMWRMLKRKDLKAVTVGSRRMVTTDSIHDYIAKNSQEV